MIAGFHAAIEMHCAGRITSGFKTYILSGGSNWHGGSFSLAEYPSAHPDGRSRALKNAHPRQG